MKNIMEYKGYIGSVEFSEEDLIFFGKVFGIRSLISYEADNAQSLVQDFHDAVDNYLNMCITENITPERAYKGSFNIRILYNFINDLSSVPLSEEISLNQYIQKTLEKAVLK